MLKMEMTMLKVAGDRHLIFCDKKDDTSKMVECIFKINRPFKKDGLES